VPIPSDLHQFFKNPPPLNQPSADTRGSDLTTFAVTPVRDNLCPWICAWMGIMDNEDQRIGRGERIRTSDSCVPNAL